MKATLEIGKEIVELRFGIYTTEMLAKKMANSDDIFNGQNFTPLGIAYILYYGYRELCMAKESKPAHTLEFFSDYVEEVAFDEKKAVPLAKVVATWANSPAVKAVIKAAHPTKNIKAKA